MDKCKYFLKDNGITLTFNSDAELVDFIHKNLQEPNIIVESYQKPWKNKTDEWNFATSYAFAEKPNEKFELVKDHEEGYYSIHFKTSGKDSLTKEEKQILVNKIANDLKIGEKLSTHGEITKGAIFGIDRFLKEGFIKTSESRILKYKDSKESVSFPILVKTTNNFIKFSKVDTGLLTKQEQVLDSIKKGIDPYSKDYVLAEDFLKAEHLIDGQATLLSPYFVETNYKELAINDKLENDSALNELNKVDPVKAKQLAEEQIELELELDKRMMKISIAMSDLMKKLINKEKAFKDSDIDAILKLVAEYNTFDLKKDIIKDFKNPTEEELKEYNVILEEYIKNNFSKFTKDNFRIQIEEWYKNISSSNSLYAANINLSKSINVSSFHGLSSWISYLSVSPEGVTDIYEIKVSRDAMKDWHSAKRITTDYKLGINRQLLENITSTSATSLYVQPVVFPTKGNKILMDSFFIEGPVDRSRRESYFSSSKKDNPGLDENGKITDKLRKLLPSRIKVDLEESNKLFQENKEVLDIMFPKYNFRTKVITKNYEALYERIVENSKDQPKLSIYDTIDKVRLEEENTPEGREKFKEVIKDYLERAAKAEHSLMTDLAKTILEAKKTGNFKEASIEFQKTFKEYLTGEWELVIDRPELLNAGILIFKNNVTLTYEAVSLTVNMLEQVNDLGLGNTILGKFKKNSFLKHDDKVLTAKTTHIETMKALTVLNTNPDIVKGYKLNTIKVFNALERRADWINLDLALYNFDLLLKEVSRFKPIQNKFSGRKPELKLTDFSNSIYTKILNVVSFENYRELRAFISQMEDINLYDDKKLKLDWFLKLREELVSNHKQLTEVDVTKIQSFDDPIEYLYYLVSAGITYYSNIDSVFDYDSPRYGIRGGDWMHWVRTTLFGSAPDYDEKGNKIVGIFQGQHFNTTDALQSVYMTKLHDLITIAQNKIVSEFNKKKNSLTNSTNIYYKESNRMGVEQYLIGDADSLHEVLFETYKGKITKDFQLKNPWDLNNNLNTAQRKYLKTYILFYYLSRKGSNQDLNTVEKFENSVEFKKLTSEGKFDVLLKPPLIKKQGVTRIKQLTTDGFRKFIGTTWDNFRGILDDRDLTGDELNKERQKIGAYEEVNGFRKMYNYFDAQESQANREGLIDKYGVGAFEINLDTIGLKYAFESIREKHYNNILPVIHAAMTSMKYYGWQSGKTKETEQALEDFFNQLKVSVFNTSLVNGEEYETALGTVKAFQKVMSVFTLAFRPTLTAKELVVGTIKNASYAWSKIYGEDSFEEKNLLKAYSLLLQPTQESYNLITELNTEFRVANRDLNQIVDKVKIDRFGLNFIGEGLYWCNTLPDYVNRLALFLAKMDKDGCFKAYSLNEEGVLVYDPSKDERYSYYLSMRNIYGKKIHPTDTKYNDQRSLYLFAIDDFNSELLSSGEKKLTEDDYIPRAYSSKQRDSIKSFADTAYGYYDKERSPLIKHLPQGIIFGQYMTFWPAKVKYYFGKPGQKSKRGYMHHKEAENPKTGKIEKYYVRYTEDENGDEYREEVPESELGPNEGRMKAVEWVGEPSEGLMYSLSFAIQALFQGKLDELKVQTVKNAKVALHDLLVYLLSIFLGIIITQDVRKKKTDPDKMDYHERLAMTIFYRSASEFGSFPLLGAIQTTPAFLVKSFQILEGIKAMMTGKEDLPTFFRSNISFLELLPPTLK